MASIDLKTVALNRTSKDFAIKYYPRLTSRILIVASQHFVNHEQYMIGLESARVGFTSMHRSVARRFNLHFGNLCSWGWIAMV